MYVRTVGGSSGFLGGAGSTFQCATLCRETPWGGPILMSPGWTIVSPDWRLHRRHLSSSLNNFRSILGRMWFAPRQIVGAIHVRAERLTPGRGSQLAHRLFRSAGFARVSRRRLQTSPISPSYPISARPMTEDKVRETVG